MKPLFIPLKGEYFDAFANGTKRVEYRLHGPRWNSSVCVVGRPVILSRGYGKARRLKGKIISFGLRFNQRQSVTDIYSEKAVLAAIGIEVDQ